MTSPLHGPPENTAPGQRQHWQNCFRRWLRSCWKDDGNPKNIPGLPQTGDVFLFLETDHANHSREDQYCDTRWPYKAEGIPDMFADGNVRKSRTNVDSCYGWADRSCQSSGKEEGCGYHLRCGTEWLYYTDDDREKCVVENAYI